jgi:hypothetical protein
MNRKRQRAEIIFKAGQLFGPLLKLVEYPESYDQDERTRIVARYLAETQKFTQSSMDFTRGEPGHFYQSQYFRVTHLMSQITEVAAAADFDHMVEKIRPMTATVLDIINSIPVPIESAIHEANTPFSTYCLAKDLCSTARSRVDWMDRYFDSTLFGRYLIDVPDTTVITLITWPESRCSGARDRQRYADFMSVSRLYALERGPDKYRLLTAENFHDRRLRCDDKMFALGDSIKDLGKNSTFMISKLDGTDENQRHFDDAIDQATEVFGPSNTTHP